MALKGCKVLVYLPEWNSKHTYDVAYVKQWIQEAGGQVVEPAEQCNLPTHVLCDVATEMEEAKGKYEYLCTDSSGSEQGVVWCSLVWLFGCLEGEEVLPVGGSVLYGPLMNTKAREQGRLESVNKWDGGDGKEIRICVTGFEKRRRRFVHTIVESLGGVFSKELHLSGARKANVLVAWHGESDGSDKANAARKHGIPVVNIQWLLDCLESWEFVSPKDEKYRKNMEFCIVFRKEIESVEDDVAVPDSQTSLHDLVMSTDGDEEQHHEEEEAKEEEDVDKRVTVGEVNKEDEDESQSKTPSHISLDKEMIGNIIVDEEEKEEEINLPSCVDQSPARDTPHEEARTENRELNGDIMNEQETKEVEKKSSHPPLPISLEPVSQDLDSSSISNHEVHEAIKDDAVEVKSRGENNGKQSEKETDKKESETSREPAQSNGQPLEGIEAKPKSPDIATAAKVVKGKQKPKPQNKRKMKEENKRLENETVAKENDAGVQGQMTEDVQNEMIVLEKKQPATKHRSKKAKMSSEQVTDEMTKDNKEKRSTHVTLSGMHSDEQASLAKILKSLRVPFTIGTHSFKPHFTHIIAPRLKRNQKCLSGLASGAWILDPSYVHASERAGSLMVDEEPYELHQGDANLGIEEGIAAYWRKKRKNTGCRAFEGLNVCLAHITSQDMPSRDDIRSIIKAGGGTLVPMPSTPSASNTPPLDIIITSSSSHLNSIKSKFPYLVETKPEGVKSQRRAIGRQGARKKQQSPQLHKPLVVTSSFIIAWLTSPSSPELLEDSVLIPESAPGSILQSLFE